MNAAIASSEYDVVIIGSGFGGAAAAFALSRAGLRTLLLERGRPVARDDRDWDAREILIDKRYGSSSPVLVEQYGGAPREERFPEALGGLSIFYGGATLRLRERDFDRWPISYAELAPYYDEAEALLEVHGDGTGDPYEPPRSQPYPHPPATLTAPAQRLYHAARDLGYRPFLMPMAINHRGDERPSCVSCFTCDGFPCKIEAKNDTLVTALRKADRARLDVVAGVAAERLLEQGERISGVACIDTQSRERFTVTGRLVIVSGGAIGSPALLLRSGLRRLDRSGTLGRNLMRHCNAIVGYLFPFRINPDQINHKQIAVTHFYEDLRQELGTSVGIIQDMCMPPAEAVRHLAPRGFGNLAATFVGRIQSLICIAEDDPRPENQVTLVEDRQDHLGLPLTRVVHSYGADDLRRRAVLVAGARRILRRAGGLVGKLSYINSFSHAVGTARFGTSPDAAALDTSCRFFGLDNLYVLDGSFMPTSGGVNPSLTIAANALRVADQIIRRSA